MFSHRERLHQVAVYRFPGLSSSLVLGTTNGIEASADEGPGPRAAHRCGVLNWMKRYFMANSTDVSSDYCLQLTVTIILISDLPVNDMETRSAFCELVGHVIAQLVAGGDPAAVDRPLGDMRGDPLNLDGLCAQVGDAGPNLLPDVRMYPSGVDRRAPRRRHKR
jgi:hypothetical protein